MIVTRRRFFGISLAVTTATVVARSGAMSLLEREYHGSPRGGGNYRRHQDYPDLDCAGWELALLDRDLKEISVRGYRRKSVVAEPCREPWQRYPARVGPLASIPRGVTWICDELWTFACVGMLHKDRLIGYWIYDNMLSVTLHPTNTFTVTAMHPALASLKGDTP